MSRLFYSSLFVAILLVSGVVRAQISKSDSRTASVEALLDVQVPMRDGIRLATDVFVPKLPAAGRRCWFVRHTIAKHRLAPVIVTSSGVGTRW